METTPQSGDTSELLPSFALNGFSLQLPLASSAARQVSSAIPRLPITQKRHVKSARPSTASAIEEKPSLLPSAPNGSIFEAANTDVSPGWESMLNSVSTTGVQDEERKRASAKKLERKSHPTLGAYLQSNFFQSKV